MVASNRQLPRYDTISVAEAEAAATRQKSELAKPSYFDDRSRRDYYRPGSLHSWRLLRRRTSFHAQCIYEPTQEPCAASQRTQNLLHGSSSKS
ncbi:hypothetical protein PENARI_c008G10863 [Penicillium arizonense]|uniref:Uncharacterized protein n=1 Tax=Penicillium arizonense TaxID=1835702 RepID=A0A1F5LIT0_PENAI|nr:hypothetical protein PENARI_c008G10863 [Penicillium arizonense]OGE53035.1 hypothetical protein PENARI_c008G10863 [Penicillium arizonense]